MADGPPATPAAKPVLVLFDVDETLVHTGGAGARSWMAACNRLYGIPADIGAHTSAGAARTKCIPANLNRFFVFGAYGSDAPDRGALTKLAIEKGARLHDTLTPAQVFVVGDTPRDIEAAQTAGAVSVGVASGHFSTTELRAAGGDHVLGSLEEPFPGL